MQRKSTDKCLLCESRDATKENSHIIPKFISSDFLGTKHNKKGVSINTEKGVTNKIQDSPKEDYLFCPECEDFFSVIESEAAEEIKKIHSSPSIFVPNSPIEELTNIPETVFHLFYYSQFWRASVCNHPVFRLFKLPDDMERYLKSELNKFNVSSRADFLAKLKVNNLGELIPYIVFSSKTYIDLTKNTIVAPDVPYPYTIMADKFILTMYTKDKIPTQAPKDSFNLEVEDRKISFLSPAYWDNLMNQFFEHEKKKHLRHKEKMNSLKFLADQLVVLNAKEIKELRQILHADFNLGG